MRAIYIIACFAVGALCSYLGASLVYQNSEAVIILITVYTVFAGFLVAIIAVLGDPLLVTSGSWQTAENQRQAIENRLIRYSYLFGLYLVTIAIIFIGVLLKEAPESIITDEGKQWIARVYLFFGVAAFMLSLALPKSLIDVQRKRVEEEIERRRKNEGIRS